MFQLHSREPESLLSDITNDCLVSLLSCLSKLLEHAIYRQHLLTRTMQSSWTTNQLLSHYSVTAPNLGGNQGQPPVLFLLSLQTFHNYVIFSFSHHTVHSGPRSVSCHCCASSTGFLKLPASDSKH